MTGNRRCERLSLFDFASNHTSPTTSPKLDGKALVILIAFCEYAHGANRAKLAAIFRGWQAVWLSRARQNEPNTLRSAIATTISCLSLCNCTRFCFFSSSSPFQQAWFSGGWFQQVLLEPSSSKPDCRSSSSRRGERGPTVTGAQPRLRLRASATWFLRLPLRLLGCSRSCFNTLLFLSMEEDMRPAQDIFSPSPRTSYSCTEAKCCAIFTQYVATEESSCSSKRCTAFFHWRAAMAASMALREQLRERAQEVSG